MIHPRVLLVLAFLVLIALPAGAGDDEIDLEKISPADLQGVDTDGLLREAGAAYQASEYERSARLYIKALSSKPGDATALYNLACCYGLLSLPEQASLFLEAAWGAGFRDIEHIGFDPDFADVREAAVFTTLMEKLRADAEKRRKQGGRRLAVETRVLGDVRVIVPDGMIPGRRYPLVVGLHGYGDNGENFARLFSSRDVEAPFIYCVPQAPYPFPSGSKLSMSWGFGGPGVSPSAGMRSQRLAEEYVLAAVSAVKREYLVDERRIFVLGFSQGAGLAYRMGMRYPSRFTAAIPVGGWCEPGGYTREELSKAKQTGLFLVCHSPDDRVVPFSACETAQAFLTENGIPHRVVSYPGGHSLPVELLRQITAWIENPAAGSAGANARDERALLRYRFPSNRALHYRTTTSVTTRVGDVRIHQQQEDLASWRLHGKTDGSNRVAITYEEIKYTLESPRTGPITYDSKSPPDPDRAQHLAVVTAASLLGKTVLLTVSPRGEVRSLTGYEDVYRKLVTREPRLESIREKFDDRLRARSMQAFLGVFPDVEMTVGSRWDCQHKITLPSFGVKRIDVEYHLESITMRDGRRLARIETKSVFPGMEGGGGKMIAGGLTGVILFDLKAGTIVRLETTTRAEFEIDGRNVEMTTRIISELSR